MTMPELPYETTDGERTAGWSGSETSHERAVREARDGTVQERLRRVRGLVASAGGDGMTWKELSTITGMHHGQCSGALSSLHKTGTLARLVLRRGNCKVYVEPRYVNGRPTEEQGRKGAPLPVEARILGRCIADEKGCLIWTGAKNDRGYGNIGLHGSTVHTHKAIYEALHGPVPPGLTVRHTCDTPPCCNPEHLLVGTYSQNTRDMIERDRHPAHMRPQPDPVPPLDHFQRVAYEAAMEKLAKIPEITGHSMVCLRAVDLNLLLGIVRERL